MHTHNNNLPFWHHLKDFLFIAIGVVSASIGLSGFLLPNDFLDGGATGVALLVNITTFIDLSILLVIINLPFVFIGWKQISLSFALKTSLAIAALATLVHIIHIPAVTTDKLLIAVFGGFFLGMGTGCAIRGGAVIDGTEVLAIAVSRKSSLTVGDFITLLNVGLFSFAALLVSIETAMYSFLAYVSASKTIDFVVNGIEEYIGVTIVSVQYEQVKEMISLELGRGVTAYKSDAGFGKNGAVAEQREVLFCVVTRLEVSKLLHEVEKVDPNAFVIQQPIKDTKGGMIKKRPLH